MRISILERQMNNRHSIEKLGDNIERILSKNKDIIIQRIAFPNNRWIEKIKIPFLAKRSQSEVSHITGDIHFASFFMNKNRNIITMHDCTLLMNKQYNFLKKIIYKLIWFILPNLCCRQIVAVSNETKRNLIKYANIDQNKIIVIYNGVDEEFKKLNISSKEKNSLISNPNSKPAVLHISNSDPNKNFKRIIMALKDIDVKLVKIGNIKQDDKRLLDKLNIDYIQLVNIPIEELVKIYNSVDCLIFPSTIEGFGLPIIEAQTCNCPVITSNQSSMPEVAGKGAIFVNPYSVEKIKRAILKVLKDKRLRERLIKEGIKNTNRFKWEDTAQQYYELYKKICNYNRNY